ncbi:acetate/propionate family kinase [Thauera linaloolentis]|uniref:Acetate kinase n=1 Tax=Thauera linaloolentis (strain DSM 12138 / JCM 21573 / CCUG 41526 / CIP 105981 / IAM 15112 / NBRC 102519 / 47Lol) TaxID=1123367 RepID=N6Y2S6_THAL4|nr:acetate/propionate family kinase [Thauera linaloolentis]ENO88496.1 acetate kinase [Thauera linaloolentis 47Lol = DSM 12138]MCM8567459.1 acetate/propionate family kinase [Thauera linaloolentis]
MKAVLVLNAGSSSLKFALYPINGEVAVAPAVSGQVEGIGATPEITLKTAAGERIHEAVRTSGSQGTQHRDALDHVFQLLSAHNPNLDIAAAGHRIVHGGEHYSAPVVLNAGLVDELERFVPLAPLHQPHNLRAVRAVTALMPSIPQVGCFDTAFHRTQPAVAQAFALPRRLSAEGVKRYGFHGLSYDYVARQLPKIIGERAQGAVVIAHLGNGASMCALRGGRSMASTMGFTAVEGLMMGTRTGSLDPGVMLYLMEQKGMDAKALTNLLYKESGLLGVSGISQDMRTLLTSDAPEAKEAVDLFCYRIARELGSLAAAAGGLDALVFTGGIGEHAAPVREKVAELAAWMGIEIDAAANADHAQRIDAAGSRVAVAVVPTNEERMIARYTADALGL